MGGRNLAHHSAEDLVTEDDIRAFLQILKINRNCFLVMDSDRKNGSAELNSTKQRILSELSESRTWVTKGREIENYLHRELILEYVKLKTGSNGASLRFGLYSRLGDALDASTSTKIRYDNSKPKHAHAIGTLAKPEHLDAYDLRDQIENLGGVIRRWNGLPPREA